MKNIINPIALGSITTVRRGLSSSYLKDGEAEVRLIKVKDIDENGHLNIVTVDTHLVKKTAALEKATVQCNDLLISLKGVAFKIALVPQEAEGFVISSNLIALRVNEMIKPEILAWYLASPVGINHLQKGAMGSSLLTLNTNHLLNINIPVPSLDKQEVISSYLHTLDEYNEIISKEQAIIAKISDALLDDVIRSE